MLTQDGPFTRRVTAGAGRLVTRTSAGPSTSSPRRWAPARRRGGAPSGAVRSRLPADLSRTAAARITKVGSIRCRPTTGIQGEDSRRPWIHRQFDRAQSSGRGQAQPDGTAYRGRFLEVVQAGHVFDGVWTRATSRPLEAFALDPLVLFRCPAGIPAIQSAPAEAIQWPEFSAEPTRTCHQSSWEPRASRPEPHDINATGWLSTISTTGFFDGAPQEQRCGSQVCANGRRLPRVQSHQAGL